MDEDAKRALEILDRACEWAREHGRYELVDEFLELIARAEAMPSNAPGTEKGFLERGYRETLEHYRRVWRDNA